MPGGPASNWDKFRLLMWKNWLLQWRHKVQMIVEILVPVVFSALLVLIRTMVHPDQIPTETHYKPCSIDNLDPLRNFNASYPVIVTYRLAYAPEHPALAELLAGVAKSLQLQPAAAFKNAHDLHVALAQQPFLAGVEFDDAPEFHDPNTTALPRDLKYALRFPSELRTGRVNPVIFNWRTDLTFPRFQYPGPRNKDGDDGGIPAGYRQEGFLAIQHSLAHEFLRMQSNGTQQMPEVVLQRFPYPPYVDDILLTGLENIVSLIIMLSFVYPCTNTVKFIAAEKERQLKESMKIMGLPNWLHWTGWFTRSMIFMAISISLMVVLLKVPWYPGNSVAIFTHSNWLLLWLFLFVYSIVTVTFCFMLSVFFSRANTAAAVSGLAWFMFYAVFTFTYQSYQDMRLFTKLALCLLSNTGMAFGFQIIIRFEGTSEGLQWSNLFEPNTVDDNLTVGYIMIMLLLTSGLYFLITLYVEKIYPGEYGVPQPWWFPFSRAFWFGHKCDGGSVSDDHTRSFHNTDHFEAEPKHKNQGVQIRSLRKVFSNNKKVAVQSMSLNMYEDEITVLLGHNGAGKSTTMAMLTGMLPPSSGTAIVNGKDINHDIAAVRSSLGLCPQHNILFDELTVEEHIEFYCRLKGYHKADVEQEIQKYLRLINLEDKRHAMSSTLSGGMKRKLSVCVAFCGGSKVVLCDEPTSGMDPAARRALWDVLKAEKIGRTVLLSTHFMDEADILGDRIAIMSSGALKACGSSYFLKKKFGVGYHLVCAKTSLCRAENVTALLQRYVPEIRIENDIGTELSYQLSDSRSEIFPEMLDDLERNLVELGLSSYGISMTTLEEVFMSVGTETEAEDHGGRAIAMQSNQKTDLTLNSSDDTYLQSGIGLARNQLIALFTKKVLQTARNWIMLCIQIAIPASFIIITVLSERSRARFQDLPRRPINFVGYQQTVTVLEAVPDNGAIANQYKSMFVGDATDRLSVIEGKTEDYIMGLYKSGLVEVNRHYIVGASIGSEEGRITAWFNNQPYHSAPLSVSLVHNAVIRAKLGELFSISVANAPMPYTADSRMEMVQLGGSMGFQLAVNVSFAMAFVGAFYVLAYIRERTSRAKLLQMVSGARVYAYWLTAFVWDYMTYTLTIVVLIAIFAAFQETGWSSATELSRILLILVVFGWAILPTTYIFSMLFTVPASGYTRMTMLYVFTGMAFFFIVFIMSMPIYNLADTASTLKWFFLVFPHFALSNSLSNINLNVQGQEICKLRCEAIPGCTMELMCRFMPSCCDVAYFKWEEPGVGRDMTYLLVTGVVAMVVLLLIEYRLVATVRYAIRSMCGNQGVRVNESDPVDADVLEERRRIETMSKMEIDTHRLVLKNVSKAYGSFVAVNHLSIGVDGSECFGLLGINGAGKTSTFKMMTGDTKITSGEAWVSGVSLRNNMNGVHQIIGYCPQFDALIDEMTGRETLTMFCRLRGVPKRRIAQTIDRLAGQLNFVQHLDKAVRAYSGGNKRKLSTAVALIGNPMVVYLDEPTTGMDPGAKRCLWNLVTSERQMGKSIVLTSHSMDECEALCTRIAIMVNGEFKCLGSVQHLKGRFSNGFTLIIRMRGSESQLLLVDGDDEDGLDSTRFGGVSRNVDDLKAFVLEQFQGANLREEYHGLLTYYIPRTNDSEWSTMFGAMEVAKRRFDIEDYSLNQISLEQVFLSFARYQREE